MDPSAGPTITAAVASFTNAAWQYAAQSTLADYFTIFAVYVFLDNRRHDSPTPDDTDLSTTKNSLSIIILFAELCRYFLPPKYVWNDHDAAPADDLIINVASEVIPSVLPIIAAFCNLILLGFEPLHNRVPSMLPTVALTTTFAFRIARYFAFESPLQSYYTDLSLVLLSLQFCLLAIQLFWKVFICTPSTTTGQEPQLPVWRKIVPNWLGTMLMLPHLEIDALEQLDALYAPPMAYGSRPLFRQLAPLYDSPRAETSPMEHFGFSVLRRQFFSIIPLRLIMIAFTYAVPYLVQDTVTLAEQRPNAHDICKTVALTALAYGGKAFSTAWYNHCRACFSTQLRTTVINAMSEKLLVMSQKTSQKFNLVNVFGKDLQNIDNVIDAFHDLWSSLLELACGLYLVTSISPGSLYMAIFAPLAVSVCEPVVEVVSSFSKGWKQAAKERIAAVDLYLDQYKELKFTGYVSSFTPHLMKLRGREIEAANRDSISAVMQLGFYAACKTAAPVAIIGTALYRSTDSNPWTVPEYFTIAAVTPLIAHSWKTLISASKIYSSGIKSLNLAQDFMQQPDLRPTDRGNPHHQSDSKQRSLQLLQTSFAAPDSTSFRYRDLRFEVGKITMIIGPQGCGKSSLLKSLLGEVQLVSGSVIAPTGPISYCGESPFVQNLSIKESIIFQKAFDPVWYQLVLHACALDTEIARLPHAGETMAGEGGSKITDLRHLVSLARAVYANNPVMVLDETFDYFEPKTADTILARLFGKGGLLRNKCTVLFTSSTSRDFAHANTILAFNETRGIQEVSPSLSNLPPGLKYDPKAFDLGPIHESTRQPIQLREKVFPYKHNSPENIRSDIASEKASILSFLAHCDSLGMLGLGISIVVMLLAVVAAKWPVAYLHTKLESFHPSDDSFIWTWAILAAAPVILVPICALLYYMTSATNASFVWHVKLMKTLEWTTVTYTIRYGYGKLAKLHEQDLTLAATSLASAYLLGTFMTISLLAEMYFAAYSFGSIAWLLAPCGFVIASIIGMNYASNDVEVRMFDFDARLAFFNNLVDLASGIEHVRAFGWQRQFLRRTFDLLSTSQRTHYYSLLMQHSLTLSIDLFILFVALVVTGFPLCLGLSTQATMGISLVTVVGLSTFTRDVIDSWSRFTAALAPVHHIAKFIMDAPKPKKIAAANFDAADTSIRWPTSGGIKFENVTAHFDLTGQDEPPILDNINVTIPAGKTVGIIGGIASGKTAFLSAILGLVDYSGRITIDGTDVRELPDLFVQRRIVSVSPYLLEFPGTLRHNLDPMHGTRFQNRLGDDVIIDVLKKLTLWSEVVRRGGTLDSPMSVMGLSRGQREVLAVARAILRHKHLDAKIVVVDGALSTVDTTLDLMVNRVMAKEFRGCTLIKVTHHLATLDDASQVIKIHKGRIESVYQPGGGRRR